ncbi:carbohydrate-binding domain-containing protein [Actinoplanes sp. NPDC048967]|uniref:carbohydrate-binding domain-containing protein n=1 Tax=Actinoplanes sp. NPDC048967 TaxID=3155269 RepID=UPI00340F1771
MHRSPVLTAALAGALALAPGAAARAADPVVLAAGPAAAQALAANAPDHDDPADHVWSESAVAAVTLTGSGATSTSSGVSISGSTVTVTAAGTYRFAGSLTNGRIVVNSTGAGLVRLILNGVTVANSGTAPLSVVAADEVMVVLADGTTNRLTDPATYTTAVNPGAALSSAADLTITGTGALTVTGNAADGIAGDAGLVIDSGTITVTAKDDGVRGQDYVVHTGGTLGVTASGDAIKSDETTDATEGYVYLAGGARTLTAPAGDGISATTDVIVAGGSLTATTGGGSTTAPGTASTKAVKAGVSVVVSDGQLNLNASDDGINSNNLITVDGGTLTVASGDDAVHADTALTVSAGSVTVTRSYEGLEAMQTTLAGGTVTVTATDDAVNAAEEGVDERQVAPNAFIKVTGGTVTVSGGTDGLDSNGILAISGGTVIANGSPTRGGGEGGLDSNGALTMTGGSILATGLTASTSALPSGGQAWVAYSFGANQPAGTIVHLATAAGTQLASFRSTRVLKGVLFDLSSLTRGTSYRIYTGGSVSGTDAGGGLHLGGTLSGTQVASVTAGSGRA